MLWRVCVLRAVEIQIAGERAWITLSLSTDTCFLIYTAQCTMTSTPVIASASTIASASASAPSPVLGPPPSGTAAFRRVVWSGTIPLSVSLDAADLPAGSDSSVDSTYLVVPRISYLPLLLDKVRTHLLELILDPTALALLKDKEWWFEADGQPLKWHWPIGLLYDYHTRNPASTSLGPLSVSPSPPPPLLPWKLRLHLSKPPLDRLHTGPSLDTCKTSFMSMLKEADFVRYGSTKRVVNLRRQEQDALWQGLVDREFLRCGCVTRVSVLTRTTHRLALHRRL